VDARGQAAGVELVVELRDLGARVDLHAASLEVPGKGSEYKKKFERERERERGI
jgi:hypothetical protein